jgi:hypothetical protein
MEDWYSRRCRLTWKMKGTKSNRLYFQLQASTLHIEETECGLSREKEMLPTPNAFDWNTARKPETYYKAKAEWKEKGINLQMPLKQMAVNGLLPTPSVSCAEGGQQADRVERNPSGGYILRKKNNPNVTYGAKLSDAMIFEANQMLPTLSATDSPAKNTGKRNQDSIPKRIRDAGGKTFQLSPLFCAEMMGFPESWTLLPFLNGETNQSKPTETQ